MDEETETVDVMLKMDWRVEREVGMVDGMVERLGTEWKVEDGVGRMDGMVGMEWMVKKEVGIIYRMVEIEQKWLRKIY